MHYVILSSLGEKNMVTLVILDGFGWTDQEYGNAVKQQGTPNIRNLIKQYPFTTLTTHGRAVGLEEGQMGGSEVGHLNIGAGRVVWQDLTKINDKINNGTLKDNKELKSAFAHVKNNGSKLHFMGLLSDGGIHSKIEHLEYLITEAVKAGIGEICIHAFMDGRDTLKDSGIKFVQRLEKKIEGNSARIASVCGRIYAMDREKRYNRLQKAYDMLVLGEAKQYSSASEAVLDSYNAGVYDEFMEPAIIGEPSKIQDNDAVIFFNYRADRAREISQAIAEQDIKEMNLVRLKNVYFVGMTVYNEAFTKVKAIIQPELVTENLAKIISDHKMKQYHISETTKYAHVTFFLNGGIEKANIGEDRELIESYNVKDFSEVPQMRAVEITEKVVDAINNKKYDFIVVNLSNADMIGHTGSMEATIETIKIIDTCASKIAKASTDTESNCLIIADHGNADYMLNENGQVITSHSMNPVPCILVSDKYHAVKLKEGKSLTSVAPTILKMLNITIPSFMDDPLF